ncbi:MULTISPECIES: helix-turn-helix domain-containing protein [Thermoactinomyces]|uniref:helix-turn-helix domain-containing protein n=1 Tax=Thermoactinomyces TaxID=2023 RepID=UPI00068CCDC2|nr:helix-turn-helix transcriptional regulator [Thermoactinomyces daqus]
MQTCDVLIDLKKIKRLRIHKGFSQEFMSKFLGYKSVLGYHYLEKGRCQMKAEHLIMIADLFQVSLDELYVKVYPLRSTGTQRGEVHCD